MEGGTTFTFVTGGIAEALERARAAAGDLDVAIAGGAATVNQFLAAGLLDELRLHVVPIVLGAGARLFADVAGVEFEPIETRGNRLVSHLRLVVVHATARSRHAQTHPRRDPAGPGVRAAGDRPGAPARQLLGQPPHPGHGLVRPRRAALHPRRGRDPHVSATRRAGHGAARPHAGRGAAAPVAHRRRPRRDAAPGGRATLTHPPGQGGLATTRVEIPLSGVVRDPRRVDVRDGTFPGRVGWTAIVEPPAAGGRCARARRPATRPTRCAATRTIC